MLVILLRLDFALFTVMVSQTMLRQRRGMLQGLRLMYRWALKWWFYLIPMGLSHEVTISRRCSQAKRLSFVEIQMRAYRTNSSHTAAFHTKSKALIPLQVKMDWDDYRRVFGEENLRTEIKRQIKELSFKPVEIKSNLIGLSINSSILLANKKEGVSFADSLVHHANKLVFALCQAVKRSSILVRFIRLN